MLTMQPAESHASATTDIQVLHRHAQEEAEASGAGHVREDSATQPAEDTAVAPTTEELTVVWKQTMDECCRAKCQIAYPTSRIKAMMKTTLAKCPQKQVCMMYELV